MRCLLSLVFAKKQECCLHFASLSSRAPVWDPLRQAHILFWQSTCILSCFHPLKEPCSAKQTGAVTRAVAEWVYCILWLCDVVLCVCFDQLVFRSGCLGKSWWYHLNVIYNPKPLNYYSLWTHIHTHTNDNIHKDSWKVFWSEGQDFLGLMLFSDLGQTR